jgi:hypothetical protein
MYDYKDEKKQIRSDDKTLSGKRRSFKWGEYREIEFSVDQISRNHALWVNSWWESDASSLAFYISSDATTEAIPCRIGNKTSPFDAYLPQNIDKMQGKVLLLCNSSTTVEDSPASFVMTGPATLLSTDTGSYSVTGGYSTSSCGVDWSVTGNSSSNDFAITQGGVVTTSDTASSILYITAVDLTDGGTSAVNVRISDVGAWSNLSTCGSWTSLVNSCIEILADNLSRERQKWICTITSASCASVQAGQGNPCAGVALNDCVTCPDSNDTRCLVQQDIEVWT